MKKTLYSLMLNEEVVREFVCLVFCFGLFCLVFFFFFLAD